VRTETVGIISTDNLGNTPDIPSTWPINETSVRYSDTAARGRFGVGRGSLPGRRRVTPYLYPENDEQVNTSHQSIRIAGALIVPILALTSCSIVTGPGSTRTESRAVSGFSKVELAGTGSLTIDQTGTESLTIEAGDKVLRNLTSDVVGDTLVLGTERGTLLSPEGRVNYHLTVKDLAGLSVSGTGEVTAPKITTDSLSSDISGSGTITVGGSAPDQRLFISGSGTYVAGDLAGKTLRANLSGNGRAEVSVSDALDVTMSGSGSLTYSGDPTLKKKISGTGSVTQE